MSKFKSEFIKYSLEITAIILGILGAFALDNWNQARLDKNLEREILAQIKIDLEVTLKDMKNDFVIHKTALKGHHNIDKAIDKKLLLNDSLIIDFYWIKQDEYIFPNTSGFETLKSFGTHLLKNKELRNSISYTYNQYFTRLTKGNNLYPDISEFLNPYYLSHFKPNRDTSLHYTLKLDEEHVIKYPRKRIIEEHEELQLIGYIPKEFRKTINDDEFQSLLAECKKYRFYKYTLYKNTIAHVEKTINQIDAYLRY